MSMDSMRKQTYQCAQYKLQIVTKHGSRNIQVSNKHVYFLSFHDVVGTREDLSINVSITNVVRLILTKLKCFLFSG